MPDIEINSDLEGETNQNISSSNESFLIQQNKWDETKSLLSKNINCEIYKNFF